jgi:hypothetical protein
MVAPSYLSSAVTIAYRHLSGVMQLLYQRSSTVSELPCRAGKRLDDSETAEHQASGL